MDFICLELNKNNHNKYCASKNTLYSVKQNTPFTMHVFEEKTTNNYNQAMEQVLRFK